MKVTKIESGFSLKAECYADVELLSAMDYSRTARVHGHTDRVRTDDGFYEVVSVNLSTSPTGNDLLQTILKLDRLLRGQPHGQGHVGADAVDPHAQERALAIIKKLNVVLDALGAVVSEGEPLQVVIETHIASPGAEKAIIDTVQRLATDDTEGGAA